MVQSSFHDHDGRGRLQRVGWFAASALTGRRSPSPTALALRGTYSDWTWRLSDPAADGNLDWRRPLWENFYPRIRREQSPEAAAEIVVRFLRERVTIAQGNSFRTAVREIWQRQIANERGFEALYVAALRSVGVPGRLDARGRAEFWTGFAWQAAPRPLLERL